MVVVLCAPALVAGAQSLTAVTQPGSGAPVGVAIPADSAREISMTAPSVTASGAPRSYQVVSIPVPYYFADHSTVVVEIVPRGEFTILGARTRTFSPAKGAKPQFAVTLGIPANAIAGRLIAAEVRFTAPGSPAVVVVPVEIDVTLVRKILLRTDRGPFNAQAGNDVVLPFEIANAGNAVEDVAADLELPSGWATRDAHQPTLEISPGETVKRRVRLKVPALSPTGSSFIVVSLHSGADTIAAETKTVEVFNSSTIGRESGPLITSSVAQATDENGQANRLLTLTANGALYDSVRVDARFSAGTVQGGAASNAFAHLGAYRSAASVVLTAPSGQLSMGNTGTSFSDLTGLYPYGQGALLHLQHPEWSVLAFGAMSMPPVGTTERKPMVGVLAEHQLGIARMTASISHLGDTGPSPRQLDAAGIGAAVPTLFGTTFKAEVAERRFEGGDGLGWSSGLVRQGPESNEELRITHAPGGSDAFARATDEVVANVSERISSRVGVSASGWHTSDVTTVFSGLKSSGYSVRPQYRLFGGTTIAIEGRSYLFDANSRPTSSGSDGGFGSREQQLGFAVSSWLRQYYVNTSAYLGNVTRTVSPSGLPTITDRTPRNYWTTNAGWSGAGGMVELGMRIEQTRDRGGFVNQQSVFGIRAEQVVLPWLGGVRGEGELQRVNGFGEERSSIVRAGVAIPLLTAFALQIDAERNSIFRSTAGRVPWIFGLRLQHALTVPMLRTPGTSGYVYEDLNGNQRRDDAEPGVAGAIVRRGGETAVADGSGKYRIGGDARETVTIDEASLPDGWSANGAARGDLGVTLSTSAEIELVVAPRSGIAAVQVDLSKAHVIARDSAGREWAALMTGPTTATFQSLPVGTYQLDFDLSELSEPLIARGPVPNLMVTGTDSKSITITLDPRPIRMWTPPAGKATPKTSAPPPAADNESKQ
jgi:hypothetical protein